MGRFKFSHLFYTIRTFIIKMTKHYFPLLLVNLLSDKPVLHPEKKKWRHQFPLGGRALGRASLAQ